MTRDLCFVLPLAIAMHDACAGTLEVELDNLLPGRPVRVEVYANEASWRAGRPAAADVVQARGARQVVRFDGLPPGRYAVFAEEHGPEVRWLKSSLLRRGASGSSFGQRRPFAAAAIEVKDDPKVGVHLVEAPR